MSLTTSIPNGGALAGCTRQTYRICLSAEPKPQGEHNDGHRHHSLDPDMPLEDCKLYAYESAQYRSRPQRKPDPPLHFVLPDKNSQGHQSKAQHAEHLDSIALHQIQTGQASSGKNQKSHTRLNKSSINSQEEESAANAATNGVLEKSAALGCVFLKGSHRVHRVTAIIKKARIF